MRALPSNDIVLYGLSLVAIAAQAMTAALAAGRRSMDWVGVCMLGSITALGGGTIRDVLLGHYPLLWVENPIYLGLTGAAAFVTILIARVVHRLNLAFLVLEMREFSHLIAEGAGPDRSAFLSAFFTLVGAHGLHVSSGLLWMIVMMVQVIRAPELGERELRRLTCLSLFWHFLDVVWIGVFTFVYLASVI